MSLPAQTRELQNINCLAMPLHVTIALTPMRPTEIFISTIHGSRSYDALRVMMTKAFN